MKKLFLFLLILGFSSRAYAEPFVVSDSSTECITCYYEAEADGILVVITVNGVDTSQIPTEADGSIKHDLQTIDSGAHIFQFRYGRAWTADTSEGDLPVGYSDWSPPFHLERPGVLPIPTGHKLSR